MSRLSDRPDLKRAAKCFALACAYSRAWSRLGGDLLTIYGDEGPQISGILRDHFPDNAKDALRELAQHIRWACDRAWALRPARVRDSTMRNLSREVAKRDGSGFYGPQP